MKETPRDPNLPHQIVIVVDGSHQIRVSCNCLIRKYGNHSNRRHLMPGFPKNAEESKAIYNIEANHDPDEKEVRTPIPTRPEDGAQERTST